MLESYSWPFGGPLSVTLQNGGSTPIDLADSDYYVNGLLAMVTGAYTTLIPSQSDILTIATFGNFVDGTAYRFKVAAPTGDVFSYSVIYGGSSQSADTQTAEAQTSNFQTAATTQNANFVVPPRYDYYLYFDLNSGDTVAFSFSVSSWRGGDDISFTLLSSTRSILLDVGKVSQYSGNYTTIFPGRYYLRFDNSYSIFTTKNVSLSYSIIPTALSIETYQWTGNTITGAFRNFGTSYIDTKNAHVSLDGTEVRGLGGTCGQTPLNPGWSCSFSIVIPNGTWVLDSPYVLSVVTPSGSFSFLVVAGGNSESVIETRPNLITFQTVNTETSVYQTQNTANQGIFSPDFFVNNTFAMIGALAGGILLIGAIFGLCAISIATRNRGKGLYGEDERRTGDSRRNVPLLVIIGLGAFSLLTVSILTPRLTFNFALLASRVPILVAGALVLITITSILGFTWVVAAILRSRRKSLRNIEPEENETVLQDTPQREVIQIQPQQIKKKCRYCGAEMLRGNTKCSECGMTVRYLGAD